MSTSRNALCWCDSGKKFKRCHWPQEAPKDAIRLQQKTKGNVSPSFEEFMEAMGIPKSAVSEKTQNERLNKVLKEKADGTRAKPSAKFIDKSQLLNSNKRKAIMDISAKYVDENWCGRTEMCQQFAMLVKYLLRKEGINSKIIEGQADYFEGNLNHSWNHYWLITDNSELIDCNIDSLPENPFPPDGLEPSNYWGPTGDIPADRKFLPKKEFTDKEEQELEEQDDETIIWKKNSIKDYEEICS